MQGIENLSIGFGKPQEKRQRHWMWDLLGWIIIGLVFFGTCRIVFSETLPDAPKPQRMDKVQWGLLAVDAGVRGLDVYSTHQMMANGNHEMFLPKAIANHAPAMVAYSAGSVALDWWVARKLVQHHRPRLAKIVTMVDVGQVAPWAIHNLFLPQRRGLASATKRGNL